MRCAAVLLATTSALIGCGSDPGSATPLPLPAPVSGVDNGAAVTFTHGMARSLVGLTDVWSYGVHPDSTPYGVFISSAELSCSTDLGTKNPPQGYTLLITFASTEVGATAEKNKLFRHAGGWLDTNGADATTPTIIKAADAESLDASLDLTWEWYDGTVGSLAGDVSVASCLEP